VAKHLTDTHTSADQLVKRYSSRWTIEVPLPDARNISAVGEARNRA
jgi:hypothetical protein